MVRFELFRGMEKDVFLSCHERGTKSSSLLSFSLFYSFEAFIEVLYIYSVRKRRGRRHVRRGNSSATSEGISEGISIKELH